LSLRLAGQCGTSWGGGKKIPRLEFYLNKN
jgi:hypothetical protein